MSLSERVNAVGEGRRREEERREEGKRKRNES